jgi:hypothetical protein
LLVPEIEKSGQVTVGLNDDISALATVAAIWAPQGDILFTTETTTTISAVSGMNLNFDLIYKHGEL